jgi:hypothetical protein
LEADMTNGVLWLAFSLAVVGLLVGYFKLFVRRAPAAERTWHFFYEIEPFGKIRYFHVRADSRAAADRLAAAKFLEFIMDGKTTMHNYEAVPGNDPRAHRRGVK